MLTKQARLRKKRDARYCRLADKRAVKLSLRDSIEPEILVQSVGKNGAAYGGTGLYSHSLSIVPGAFTQEDGSFRPES